MHIRLNGRASLLCVTIAALGVAVAAGQPPTQTPSREEYLKRSHEFSARMESTGLKEPKKVIEDIVKAIE